MKKHEQRQLKLWKARQEAEGHDVSGVNTLEEAKLFFDQKAPAANAAPSGQQTPATGKPKQSSGKPKKTSGKSKNASAKASKEA